MDSNWYVKAPAGSPDTYVTTRSVEFTWVNSPEWIKEVLSRGIYTDSTGSLFSGQGGVLLCRIRKGFYFDVSLVGGNTNTLPAALPHDWMYAHAVELSNYYGISRREMLHIADHWFLATLRMSKWLFPKTYFLAVRTFGYAFNSLMGAFK